MDTPDKNRISAVSFCNFEVFFLSLLIFSYDNLFPEIMKLPRVNPHVEVSLITSCPSLPIRSTINTTFRDAIRVQGFKIVLVGLITVIRVIVAESSYNQRIYSQFNPVNICMQDSPVFQYINGLSPIEPVKAGHAFHSLALASPSSLFRSPQIDCVKR